MLSACVLQRSAGQSTPADPPVSLRHEPTGIAWMTHSASYRVYRLELVCAGLAQLSRLPLPCVGTQKVRRHVRAASVWQWALAPCCPCSGIQQLQCHASGHRHRAAFQADKFDCQYCATCKSAPTHSAIQQPRPLARQLKGPGPLCCVAGLQAAAVPSGPPAAARQCSRSRHQLHNTPRLCQGARLPWVVLGGLGRSSCASH